MGGETENLWFKEDRGHTIGRVLVINIMGTKKGPTPGENLGKE